MRPLARFTSLAFLALALLASGAQPGDTSQIVSDLINPAKLATLAKRGANPRVQKYVYWLAMAQSTGANPKAIAEAAVVKAGYTNTLAAKLTVDAMVRNLAIATRLGCLDQDGLNQMRLGKSPTVRKGPYAGDKLTVDHIVPIAAMPQLGNVIANLELLPQRLNAAKKAKLGTRQRALIQDCRRAGWLSQ